MASSVDAKPRVERRCQELDYSPVVQVLVGEDGPEARGMTRRSSDPRRITVCKCAVKELGGPSLYLGRSRTVASWTTVSSRYAQVEINVQCSAAGAMWERIVEKGPRPSRLVSSLFATLLTTTRAGEGDART
jgi:hypothetical protein